MNLIDGLRTMDKRLRLMLIGTGLLVVPQIGQFVTIRDINTAGHESDLALVFALVTIFAVPTCLILTATIVYLIRTNWREHRHLVILAALNTLISISLAWFFVHPCSWSQVFGIALHSCSQ